MRGQFNNNNCLDCHPAECHSASKAKVDENKNGAPCEPKIVENLILPEPLTVNTCEDCHASGCTRSTRCYDCHSEHLDGMLIPVNRSDEVFPTKFVFPAYLTEALDSDHQSWSVKVMRMAPVAELKSEGELVASRINDFVPHMPSDNCLACHPAVLTRTTPTPDQVDKSIVPRSVFLHNSPGHIRYQRCRSCHRRRWLVERDPYENIFTMEACSKKCHYADDCAGCHKFHDTAAKPGEHVDLPLRLQYQLESTPTATPEDPGDQLLPPERK